MMILRLNPLLVLLTTFATCMGVSQNWPNLKMGYIYSTWYGNGFIDHPRTIDGAKKASWTPVDDTKDCNEAGNGKFFGYRFAPPKTEPTEITLIYDVNGYIAGMQSVVPKDKTFNDKYFKFSTSKLYNQDVINGVEVYVTTAYFVDPTVICEVGRTQKEFDRDGTGDALFFQNGPTPKNIEAAPLSAQEAKGTDWFRHKCVENMGEHWLKMGYGGTQACDEGFPVFLLFEMGGDRSLVGFVWSHVAWFTNFRNEHCRSFGLSYIFEKVPQCVYDLSKDPGMTSLHVYLKDYKQTC